MASDGRRAPTKINGGLALVDGDEGELRIATVEDIAAEDVLRREIEVAADACGDQTVAAAEIEVAADGLLPEQLLVAELRGQAKSRVDLLVEDRSDLVEATVDARRLLSLVQR